MLQPAKTPASFDELKSWIEAGAKVNADSEPEQDDPEQVQDKGDAMPVQEPARGSAGASARRVVADLAVWAKIGLATVLNGVRKAPVVLPVSLKELGQRLRTDRSLQRHVLAVLVLIGVGLAGLLLIEPASSLAFASCFLLAALALLPRVWPGLGLTSYFRLIAMAVLVLTGLISTVATGLVKVASEKHLLTPDLRMLMTTGARAPLTAKYVDELQGALASRVKGSGPSSAIPQMIFGRHSLVQVRTYVPQDATGADKPRCDADGRDRRQLSAGAQGLTMADPMLSTLSWRPVGWDKASIANVVKVGARPSSTPVGIPAPDLAGDVRGGDIHVSYDFLARDLQLAPENRMVRWLCLDIAGSRDYAPFRVTAILDRIPDYDVQKYDYLLNIDAAAAGVSSRGIANPSAVAYSALAIDALPAYRDEVLSFLRELAGEKKLSLEVGFTKLESAVGAASVAVWLARAFGLVVLMLSAIVTTVITLQFIDNNRRELAVASAFGATVVQLFVLVATILLVPLLLALAVAVAFALFVLPQIYDVVARHLALPPLSDFELWIALAQVGIVGMVIVMVVAMSSLLLWRYKAGPLATQLQDVA